MATMDLHGQAMLDYLNGDKNAYYMLRRDDGVAFPPIYARQFFHESGLDELDEIALSYCQGRVLDLGAGAGTHSLHLQKRGLDVTAVDISPKAVAVMARRGVENPQVGDVFYETNSPFDTVLIMLNIGIVRTLDGLERFLNHLDLLLKPGGQLITDSMDPRNPDDEQYRQYQERKRAVGSYFGERTLRFEYKGEVSDWFEWLHLDPKTLRSYCVKAGLTIEKLAQDGSRYLVRIRRQP